MNTPVIGHQAISASAGSGKTFQLAHRYIRLLAGGVTPDRIIALTFSRKAAGEIFDSIIEYLCKAASSPDDAAKTAALIRSPSMTQTDFLALLKKLLVALNRLHVGTLDSFTVGVIRSFPMELGISADLELREDEGPAGAGARQEVLDAIFSSRRSTGRDLIVNSEAQTRFLEAYRQATFGQEEKGLDLILQRMISDYRNHFQLLSRQEAWASPELIWPGGSSWLAPPGNIHEACRCLEQTMQGEDAKGRWRDFASACGTFMPGSPWKSEVKYLFAKLTTVLQDLRNDCASLKLDRRPYDLSPEQCRAALVLVHHLVHSELIAAVERTRGIYRVLEQYDILYEKTMRVRGKLTFADAQYLLAPSSRYGRMISRTPSEDGRLYIDYRLDCKLDHWLLDEFQDTSDIQWEVLRNLIDEVVQDDSGQRSFFYVGDVKQAIYGWRGGNAKLFSRILDCYQGCIEEVPLSTSYRSCQAVIDTVNDLFGSLGQGGLVPTGTVNTWERAWQQHRCEADRVPATGYAVLLEPPCGGGEEKPSEGDRCMLAARLIQEIRPLERGLSLAVLMRTNMGCSQMVDILRTECPGVKVVHEGRASINDSPVVSTLLSLVKFAAHPGDTLAWRHIQMGPLSATLPAPGPGRHALPATLLQKMQAQGYRGFIAYWGSILAQLSPLDGFGSKRLKLLIEAAGEFDASGGGTCDEFVLFAGEYQTAELAADDAVRVMTIHQSKGLGFDIVMLPDLQSGSMQGTETFPHLVGRHPQTEQPLWILKAPRSDVAEVDDVLRERLVLARENAAFEELCTLYVATTRAKQGLYIITSFPGKNATAITPAAFVKCQLAGDPKPVAGDPFMVDGEECTCLYEQGDRDWYQGLRMKTAPSETAVATSSLPEDFRERPSVRQPLQRLTPSGHVTGSQRASLLFDIGYSERLDLGTAVHELFEAVTWSGDIDASAVISEWTRRSGARYEIKQEAVAQFRRALESQEVRQTLSPLNDSSELWRERHFEVVLGGKWVTGVFDRVVINRDTNGIPASALIIDFKSDDIASGIAPVAERYRGQMSLYRQALSKILQLDPDRITCRLVFTQAARVYDVVDRGSTWEENK